MAPALVTFYKATQCFPDVDEERVSYGSGVHAGNFLGVAMEPLFKSRSPFNIVSGRRLLNDNKYLCM